MRIGLFGGTFDPPHIAHIKLAEAFFSQYKLDKLYICPDNIPYHKQNGLVAEHRYNMTKLAFHDINNSDIIVSDMEIKRGGNTYTVDTVLELKKMYPECDKVYVLCGTDMIASLPAWHNADVLFQNAVFVHASRESDDLQAEENAKLAGAEIQKLEFEKLDVSSTQIRNNPTPDKLAKSVYDYINSNLLYFEDKEYDLAKIKDFAKSHENEKRYIHTLGVEKCALEIKNSVAPQLSDNTVSAAALLHDITKILDCEQHLQIFTDACITLTDEDLKSEKVFHSRTGAILAKKLFDVSKPVYNAIWNHTTGEVGMSILDKIIFLADYIEENRTYIDCVELRNFYLDKMASSKSLYERIISLNETMLYSFKLTINELVEKNAPIYKSTLLAKESIENENKFLKGIFGKEVNDYAE